MLGWRHTGSSNDKLRKNAGLADRHRRPLPFATRKTAGVPSEAALSVGSKHVPPTGDDRLLVVDQGGRGRGRCVLLAEDKSSWPDGCVVGHNGVDLLCRTV